MEGAGFPAGGVTVVSPTDPAVFNLNAQGGRSAPIANTFRFYGDQQTPAVVYSGVYTFTAQCQNNTGAVKYNKFIGHHDVHPRHRPA